MNSQDSNMAAQAICFAADRIANAYQEAAYMQERPSVLYRPKIFIEGDHWCALYGDNLQDGVAGFGKSPSEAMNDFERNWNKNLGS